MTDDVYVIEEHALPWANPGRLVDSSGNDWLVFDGAYTYDYDTRITLAAEIYGIGTMAEALFEVGRDIYEVFIDGRIENARGTNGDDSLYGNEVANILYGDNSVDGPGGEDLIFGAAGNDIIYGGAGYDSLLGEEGDDRIYGNAGIDTIYGGTGRDLIFGGDGDDTLNGGAGADTLFGGTGLDTASYRDAGKGVTANLQTASLNTNDAAGDSYSSIENLEGSSFSDRLTGDDSVNRISGGDGDDRLYLGGGNDAGYGGNGDDTVYGEAGNDVVYGGAGNDTLNGGAGADRLSGGSGTDTASYWAASRGVVADLATPSANTNDAEGDSYSSIENLSGSGHADRLTGTDGINQISGGDGDDRLYLGGGSDTGSGGNGHDIIFGERGNDTLSGGAGNDTLNGGAGADRLSGGSGVDTASYAGAAKGVVASLKSVSSNTNDAAGDRYSSIENLGGSNYSDKLTGNDVANRLHGGNGDDTLNGGLGRDVLIGGSGRDTFVFDTKLGSTNIDTIDDYSVRDDRIVLDNDIFTKAGAIGDLAAGAFRIGTGAQDASDRIIYDNTSGKLWYDADGSGSGRAIQFAVLDENLAMNAGDFDIIG